MTKKEQIASILLEAAELLKNDPEQESLNEGIISWIKNHKKKKISHENCKHQYNKKETTKNEIDTKEVINQNEKPLNFDPHKVKKEIISIIKPIINESRHKEVYKFYPLNYEGDNIDNSYAFMNILKFDIEKLWLNNSKIKNEIENMSRNDFFDWAQKFWDDFDEIEPKIERALQSICQKYNLEYGCDGDKWEADVYVETR